MNEEQRIHELVKKLIKSQRDFDARLITDLQHSKNIEEMEKDAKLYKISSLSILNFAVANKDKLEKELDSAGYSDADITTLSAFTELFKKKSNKSISGGEFHEALAKHVKMIPDFDYHK